MAPKRKITQPTAVAAGQQSGDISSLGTEQETFTQPRQSTRNKRSAVERFTPAQASNEDNGDDGEEEQYLRETTPASAARSRAATPEDLVNNANQAAPTSQPPPPGPSQQHQPSNVPAAHPTALPAPSRTGFRSSHGTDGSLIQMLLAGQEKMITELQSHSVLMTELRDDQRELLKLQKDKSQGGAAVAEEPATLDSAEVAECMEIAQKVFREDPYAENKMVVQHITNFFGSRSQYELEKVKGPKKFSLIKAKVNERLKNVRFNTASTTRDVMKEKHKDALTDKAVVRNREKAEALFKKYQILEDDFLPLPVLELARAVYKERVVDTGTGTISNLTKAQVAFIWSVAVWTLHPDGSEKLPMGQNSTYDRIKRKVAAALDPLEDNRQFQWSQR